MADTVPNDSISPLPENVNTQKHKQSQFEVIQATNPMWDDYHTGIRSVNDIRTWEEVLALNDESEGQFVWGDFSREDAEQALKDNSITVYSSHPIENGAFVSTSYIQAREYAGGKSNSKVYSKTVPLNDVAWINGDEGQFARTIRESTQEGERADTKYYISEGKKISSSSLESIDIYSEEEYNNFGWARNVEAISKNELDDVYSKICEKGSLKKFPQSGYGEAIIEVNNKPHTTLDTDNVFAFVTGTKNNPQITKVVRFQAKSDTEMEFLKEYLYERGTFNNTYYEILEQVGIAREYSRKSALDYIGYTEEARRRAGRTESNRTDGSSGIVQNGTGTLEQARSDNIVPINETSSTDDVFFDGENTKQSLSREGEQRNLGGSYLFDGKDFGVKTEDDIGPVRETFEDDIAPVAEDLTTKAQNSPVDGDIAPIAPKSERIADGTRSDELLNESLDNYPVQTIEHRVAEKIRAVEGELADNRDLRIEAENNYNSQIANLRSEYAALKNHPCWGGRMCRMFKRNHYKLNKADALTDIGFIWSE